MRLLTGGFIIQIKSLAHRNKEIKGYMDLWETKNKKKGNNRNEEIFINSSCTGCRLYIHIRFSYECFWCD